MIWLIVIALACLICSAATLLLVWLGTRKVQPIPIQATAMAPRKHIGSGKCHCERSYPIYEGEPDPGKCKHCIARTHGSL
jgi:hypothetical protein